ncbi:MAG: c-type cytochrome [Bacteroidetes bacterium]|nr:c-type cytochrome [Bacteroidota bacterium]
MTRTATTRIVLTAAAVILLAGCRGTTSPEPPVHPNPNMDTQQKLKPQRSSAFFADGKAMRTPPEGSVARGELREDAAFFTGKNDDGSYAAMPFAVEAADLERGAKRYAIYCKPCHGEYGDGKGIIADPKYKYPIPPTSYHEQRIKDMADGNIFEVISNGIRNMPSYRQQIPVRDRWCIVTHVRELQKHGAPASAPAAAQTQTPASTTTETTTTETAQ